MACYQRAETFYIVDNKVSMKIFFLYSLHPTIIIRNGFRALRLAGLNEFRSFV